MTDNPSGYRSYQTPKSPVMERDKSRLSSAAKELIARGDYIAAAEKKLEIAYICVSQGKQDDAHRLEVSARELIDKAAHEKEQYTNAAEALRNWAARLRAKGQERDAYLLDVTASQYERRSTGRS